MKKYLLFFLTICRSLVGLSTSLQIIDNKSENIEEIIAKILEIQKSLLIPIEAVEMPDFADTGFLTIRMTPDYLRNFLDTGKFIMAFRGKQVAGYLLLDDIEGFLKWAQGRRFDSEWDLESLRGIQYIDQIGIPTKFAKQGIGKELINFAKSLSPKGLLTDNLFDPYPNPASAAFFTSQGFTHLGVMHVEATAIRPAHKISVMLWHPEDPH